LFAISYDYHSLIKLTVIAYLGLFRGGGGGGGLRPVVPSGVLSSFLT